MSAIIKMAIKIQCYHTIDSGNQTESFRGEGHQGMGDSGDGD